MHQATPWVREARQLYVTDAVNVLLRRWYVLAIGALVLIAGGVLVVATVPTNYQASGQMLLLPPTTPSRGIDQTNPYLELPDGLTFTASLLASTLSNPDTERDMVDQGFTSAYTVAVPPQAGPILVISAKDTDQAAALAVRDELLRRLETTLVAIQDNEGTPTEGQIVARPFNVSSKAEVLAGSKVRAFAMLGGLIIVVTLLAAFAIDRQASARKRPRDQPPRPMIADLADSADDTPPMLASRVH